MFTAALLLEGESLSQVLNVLPPVIGFLSGLPSVEVAQGFMVTLVRFDFGPS